MLLPHAVQIGVVMYIYEGYKGGGRAIKGRARDKITLDVTHIICHIHFKLTRLTVQAQIPSSVTYFMHLNEIKDSVVAGFQWASKEASILCSFFYHLI